MSHCADGVDLIDRRIMDATIQRIDYRNRLVGIVVEGKVQRLPLAPDCQLWFEGRPAVLRCFHPMDPVKVTIAGDAIQAMHARQQLYA